MNYINYFQDGGSIVKQLIKRVMQSQGQDQEALGKLVQMAKDGDQEALTFIKKLQEEMVPAQQDGGRVVKDEQPGPGPHFSETGTVDGRQYEYTPYQGEGMTPTNRFRYTGEDGNLYGLDVVYRGEGMPNDSIYTLNGRPYNDPEGRKVIADRQNAVVSQKCGGKAQKKQLGGTTVKAKKAECGCLLKKVGGRLVEIDGCTGQVLRKN